MRDVFTQIYNKNHWGSRETVSGPGSEIAYTKTLRSIMPAVWERFNVRKLIDAPCGDFNWMKYVIVDSEIEYIGFDIVPQIIQKNAAEYGGHRRKFEVCDITVDSLPSADIWMCRDCLFHFSINDIWRVIDNFKRSEIRYFFTTRVISPANYVNQDINTGEWRALDLMRPPFNFDPEPVFRVVDYLDGSTPPREMCVWTKDQMARVKNRDDRGVGMANAEMNVVWNPNTRREKLLTKGADIHADGLEIGAANNPLVRSARCRYADYADTETLRRRFRKSNYHGAELIVEVDYVWSGSGPLGPIVGEQRFDYVIASHVLEHVPNPVGWFRGIAEVIRPGGTFNLAIPDQRFTFDIACPQSSLGELIEAYLLNYNRPSPRQIFDNCYYGKAVDPGEPWVHHVDPETKDSFSPNATSLAYEQAARSLQGEYFDSHCWEFTPRSFLLLLRGVCDLGLFDYIIEDYHPTIEGEFEFFLNLKKPSEPLGEALRINQMQMIDFFLNIIDERDRKLKLLME